MSKAPSDATLLRQAKSKLSDMERQFNTKKAEAEAYRVRATKAEQEVAEWKKRFDILLAREPKPLNAGEKP